MIKNFDEIKSQLAELAPIINSFKSESVQLRIVERVLRTDLSFKDKVLLLLHSDPQSGVLIEDLFKWTDRSNLTVFKRDVIQSLHRELLVEYDRGSEIVYISPLGTKRVEKRILAQREPGG